MNTRYWHRQPDHRHSHHSCEKKPATSQTIAQVVSDLSLAHYFLQTIAQVVSDLSLHTTSILYIHVSVLHNIIQYTRTYICISLCVLVQHSLHNLQRFGEGGGNHAYICWWWGWVRGPAHLMLWHFSSMAMPLSSFHHEISLWSVVNQWVHQHWSPYLVWDGDIRASVFCVLVCVTMYMCV